MEKAKYITMDGASLEVGHILSFGGEKEFVDHYKAILWQDQDQRIRVTGLKSMYKKAFAETHKAEKE